MEAKLQLTRLIVYYNSQDIYAKDITFNEIINGINNISFTLDGIQNELFSTWNDRYDEQILIWYGEIQIGIGYIQSMVFKDSSASFTAMGVLVKLAWTLLQSNEGKYLVSDGKVYASPSPTSIALLVENTQNEKPDLIDGGKWVDDQFNDDINNPYYVEITDATTGISNYDQYAIALTEDPSAEPPTGSLSDTYNQDSVFWVSEKKNSPFMGQEVKIDYSLISEAISITSNIKSCKINLVGQVEWNPTGISTANNFTVNIYWSKSGVLGSETYNLFSQVNSNTDPKFINFTITADFPIDLDNSIFFNDNTSVYTTGYIWVTLSHTGSGGTLSDSYIRLDYTELKITYDTEEFESFSQKISDTFKLAESLDYSQLKCYDDLGVADNFIFGSRGIATGDFVSISIAVDSVIREIFTNTGVSYEFNNGIEIEKGFAQRYKGGTPKLDIFKEICNAFNYIYWSDRAIGTIYALKEEDIPAATYTYDSNNSPPSDIGDIDAPNNLYGFVSVRYAGGSTVRVQADVPINNPKELFLDRPSIASGPAAYALAKEKANYHSVNHYSVQCVWNYVPTKIPQVGTKYNIEVKDGLGATTTLTNQICRRVTFKQDGTLTTGSITAFFGSASTPGDEKRGKVLGQLESDRRLDRSFDYEGRTLTTITNISPTTYSQPLKKTGNNVSLLYGEGLALDAGGNYLKNVYYDVHVDTKEQTGWIDGLKPVLSFDGNVLSIGSGEYYLSGVKGSFGSTILDLSLYFTQYDTIFIYLNSSGNLVYTLTPWVVGQNLIFICIVYYQSANQVGLKEQHGCVMDHATHERLHKGGPIWNEGIDCTFAIDNTFDCTEGTFNDEDNEHTITGATDKNCRIVYQVGSDWVYAAAGTAFYRTGGAGRPTYNNSGTETEIAAGNHWVNYWMYVTPDFDGLPYCQMGEVDHAKLLDALDEIPPAKPELGIEWVAIFRITIKADGTLTSTDLRVGGRGTTGTSTPPSTHNELTGKNNGLQHVEDTVAVDYLGYSYDLNDPTITNLQEALAKIDSQQYLSTVGGVDVGGSDLSNVGVLGFDITNTDAITEGKIHYENGFYGALKDDNIINFAHDSVIRCKNYEGATIDLHKWVYLKVGTSPDGFPRVGLAKYNNQQFVLGLTLNSSLDFAEVSVMTKGLLTGINTSSYSSGDTLWLSSNGDASDTKGSAPNYGVYLGFVVYAHASEGVIYIDPQHTSDLFAQTTPTLSDPLNANGNRVYGLPAADSTGEPVRWDEIQGLITASEAVQAVEDAGLVLSTTKVYNSADESAKHYFSYAGVGHPTGGDTNTAYFGHRDTFGDATKYAVKTNSLGTTRFNSGGDMSFSYLDSVILWYSVANNEWRFEKKISMQNLYRIEDLVDPAAAQDAATKKYVDDNSGVSAAEAVQAVEDAGLVLSTTKVYNSADESAKHYFSYGGIGHVTGGNSNTVYFGHRDTFGDATKYAVRTNNLGTTRFNSGGDMSFSYLDSVILWYSVANNEWRFDKPISMQTQKITDVLDPTDNQDVATKKYVDDTGGISVAEAVQGVEDAGLVLSTTKVYNSADESAKHYFSYAGVGHPTGGDTNTAYFGHRDTFGAKQKYAIQHSSTGVSTFNSGGDMYFSYNDTTTLLKYSVTNSRWEYIKPIYMSGLDIDLYSGHLKSTHSSGTVYIDDTVDMNSKKITDLADGTAVTDAATVGQLLKGQYCNVITSATQTIATSTATYITWDAEQSDTNGWHSTSTNPSRITVPAAGTYQINASVHWNSATSGRFYIALHKNRTLLNLYGISNNLGSGFGIETSCIGEFSLAANDYIEVLGYQDSGVSKGLVSGRCFFQVRRIE
jgi:hypothetical protein